MKERERERERKGARLMAPKGILLFRATLLRPTALRRRFWALDRIARRRQNDDSDGGGFSGEARLDFPGALGSTRTLEGPQKKKGSREMGVKCGLCLWLRMHPGAF